MKRKKGPAGIGPRKQTGAGRPLPQRMKLQLKNQATYMQCKNSLASMPPLPKSVEVPKTNVVNFRDYASKKARPTSCGMKPGLTLYRYKHGADMPCYRLCPELEAWFKFVEPIPNGVCWLDKKEQHIQRRVGSMRSRRLSHDLSAEEGMVWDKLRPFSLKTLYKRVGLDTSDLPPDGETIQYLVDNIGTTMEVDRLNNPARFSAATYNTRLPIMPKVAAKAGFSNVGLAVAIRNSRKRVPLECKIRGWYIAPMKITEELIHHRFMGSMPIGRRTPDRPKLSKRLPSDTYTWKEHVRREKAILRLARYRPTIGWKKHLEGKTFYQSLGTLGPVRTPIGIDGYLGKDPESLRYYAYWHNVDHWPVSRAEEYKSRACFDEDSYRWWLYNTRVFSSDDHIHLDKWLEKRSCLNPPRLKYERVPLYHQVDEQKSLMQRAKENFVGLFRSKKSGQPKEIKVLEKNLPLLVGAVRTEYVHTFDKAREAVSRPRLTTPPWEELSVEDQIGLLEDHCYEQTIRDTLKRTQCITDDFMLNLAKTEQQLKEGGDQVEYLAFKQALPLIAETLKRQFPLPVLEDNEIDFVERIAANK